MNKMKKIADKYGIHSFEYFKEATKMWSRDDLVKKCRELCIENSKLLNNINDFWVECKNNSLVNFSKNLENRVDLDYVIERLEDIVNYEKDEI